MKNRIVVLVAILLSVSVGLYAGRLSMHSRVGKTLARCGLVQENPFSVFPAAANLQKQDFEKRYDAYAEEEKAVILQHAKKALSGIGLQAPELEKAAAINDYIFQYLVYRDNTGNAPKLLQEGYAKCGGAVVCMTEMLYAIGIKTKLAFLLAIPDQGAHSLVEVFFADGRQGLFDPTFGIFWYDPERRRPVSMMELLENPSLSKTTLYKSKNKKRENPFEGVKMLENFVSAYSLQLDYSETNYDPYACFSQRMGGGVANEGLGTFVKVNLEPGVVLGSKSWKPKDGGQPWSALSLLHDENGRFISWAYMLGQTMGYDIKHIYGLSGMKPGREYAVKFYYCLALNDATLSVQFIDSPIATCYRRVENRDFSPDGFAPLSTEVKFTAWKTHDKVLMDLKGIMIIHAIELAEAP